MPSAALLGVGRVFRCYRMTAVTRMTVSRSASRRLVLCLGGLERPAFWPGQLHKRQLPLSSYLHGGALWGGLLLPFGECRAPAVSAWSLLQHVRYSESRKCSHGFCRIVALHQSQILFLEADILPNNRRRIQIINFMLLYYRVGSAGGSVLPWVLLYRRSQASQTHRRRNRQHLPTRDILW